MKKLVSLTFVLCVFLLFIQASGKWNHSEDFLHSGVTIAASGTSTNGTDFTSTPIDLSAIQGQGNVVLITLTFTGDGSMTADTDIDYYYQVSYDGTNWTTDEYVIVDVDSDASHSSNVVIHSELLNIYGVRSIRLWKVINNDSGSIITAVNSSISW